MLLVTLWYNPATVPLTLTEKVHVSPVPLGGIIVAPLRLMVDVPETAVIVWPDIPVQAGTFKPFGFAMTKPSGRTSVKLTLVNWLELGLVKVKVRVLVLAVDAGEKAFDNVGATGLGQPVTVMPSNSKLAFD